MAEETASVVKQRQEPLRSRYVDHPGEAWVNDHARTLNTAADDPLHGIVVPANNQDRGWRFGLHRAVGGFHDAPNPGDILCAALAACQSSTLRMIADRLGVAIHSLEVAVTGEVDVRGALVVDTKVPVGFQRLICDVRLEVPDGTNPATIKMLLTAAEHSCVVLQTLRNAVEVKMRCDAGEKSARV